jgi:hypothetical protein
MNLGNVLSNEAAQTVIIAAVGLLWAAIKGSSLYKKWVTERKELAVKAIEAAVSQVYLTFVKPAKRASANGSLTAGEAAEARALAARAAVELGQTAGVDVKGTLGDEFLALYIEQAVARAKRGGYTR